jgi:hypothetical protein
MEMTSKLILDENKIESYRAEYAATNCIFVGGFVEQTILQSLLKKLDEDSFKTKLEMDGEDKFGKVLALLPNHPAVFILNMLLNNPQLFDTLQQITGCAPINNFTGRIHRSESGQEHEIGWHGDNSDNRLLAISLGLGTDSYTGAKFQLRKKGTEHNLREFGQLEAGEAIIFKIDPELQHRLTVLEDGRRTVGVGWFRGVKEL